MYVLHSRVNDVESTKTFGILFGTKIYINVNLGSISRLASAMHPSEYIIAIIIYIKES